MPKLVEFVKNIHEAIHVIEPLLVKLVVAFLLALDLYRFLAVQFSEVIK
jgi:hypothetical protein